MIYPKISIEGWLEKHPTFKEDLPLKCLCGREVYDFTPFVTSNAVGISTGKCVCGVQGAEAVSIPRTEKARLDLLNAIY